ncbi:MAG: selenium-dependent molybdenum cofactor biosynthesis protein YqeB [Proteobacteria bacterium]|nr:selenium-dependent molybdenum cofactor biosynthesis protein YqeB [Pseudomonadota bacterium]
MTAGTGIPVSPFILVKGAGEMASAVAWRLYMANMRRICMLDLDQPLCVRRQVSFCTALESGEAVVEGVGAIAARDWKGIEAAWKGQSIAVVRVTDRGRIGGIAPDIVIDAILAKRNLGTGKDEAPLVIALGPGFTAGTDCHLVIETNRGHDLGRIITVGSAAPNTGIPGEIAGHTDDRVLRAPATGRFQAQCAIGDLVRRNDVIGQVAGHPVPARLDGMLRGMIRSGTAVTIGLKLGDIDPRGKREHCDTISDKARAIAGAVLEGVMRYCNQPSAAAEQC